MSKDGIVCLLMILNVNTYANVILERSLRTNEGHIGVNESIMTVMKQIWTQMNVYFPQMKSKRCTKYTCHYLQTIVRKRGSLEKKLSCI